MNPRVFRRNSKRTIIIWDKTASVLKAVYNEDKLVKFSFVNVSNKLNKNSVEGISIDHKENNLNPFSDYKLKMVFSDGKSEEIVEILIFSIKSNSANNKIVAYMYAYDYEKEKWVPVPIDFFKK